MRKFLNSFASIAFGLGVMIMSHAAHGQSTLPAYKTWHSCAEETGTCIVPYDKNDVRFGAGTKWVQKTYGAGKVECSNRKFGDPVPGVKKACEHTLQYQFCADEGGTCTLPGRAYVRFGAGTNPTRWTGGQATITGSIACNSSTFGGDPIPGTRKQCQYALVYDQSTRPTKGYALKGAGSSAAGDGVGAAAELGFAIADEVEQEGGYFVRSGGLHGLRDGNNYFWKLPNSTSQCHELFGTGYVCEAGKVDDANCGSCCAKGAPLRCTDYKSGDWRHGG